MFHILFCSFLAPPESECERSFHAVDILLAKSGVQHTNRFDGSKREIKWELKAPNKTLLLGLLIGFNSKWLFQAFSCFKTRARKALKRRQSGRGKRRSVPLQTSSAKLAELDQSFQTPPSHRPRRSGRGRRRNLRTLESRQKDF